MLRRFVFAFLLASAVAACHIADPSQNTNETRSGTVAVNGSSTENFGVSKSGEITVTVTNLQPSLAVQQFFGAALGQQTSGQCSIISTNGFGIVGSPVITSPIQPGAWCVVVYDVGFFKSTTTYSMTISHP